MAQAPVMPVWTDALLGDTTHLSAEEFGAYCLILLTTWRHNARPLPDDDKQLALVCRSNLAHFRKKLRPMLEPFFIINDTGWHQPRLEREWQRVAQRIDKNRRNLAKAGNGGANGAARAAAKGNGHSAAEPMNHELIGNSSNGDSVRAREIIDITNAAVLKSDRRRASAG